MKLNHDKFIRWGSQGGRMAKRLILKSKNRNVWSGSGREKTMVALYKGGLSLEQVGDKYGVTRERVRQILAKFGVTGKDRGADVLKKITGVDLKKKHQQQVKILSNKKYIKYLGCSLEKYVALTGERPLRNVSELTTSNERLGSRYFCQMRNAKARDIEWQFTFEEWFNVWRKSGKLHNRGVGNGKYCMARNGDIGPYSAKNVSIILTTKNSSDARKNALKKTSF